MGVFFQASRDHTLTGSNPYVTASAYNPLGLPNQRTWGNGAVTSWVYYGEDGPPAPNETSYRLWQVRTVKGSTVHQQLEYGYDGVGNVSSIVDYTLPGGPQTQSFGYDALDRLTSAEAAGGSVGLYGENYSYTDIGNTDIGNLKNKNDVIYTYPEPGDPQPHAVTSTTAGDSFVYDDNGNMTTRIEDGVTYGQAWDVENRLQSVTFNGQTTTFTYDGNGALVKKDDGVWVTDYAGGYERTRIPDSRNWVIDNFDDGNDTGWSDGPGSWVVESGEYSGSHTADSVSVWNAGFKTGKLYARLQAKGSSGPRNGGTPWVPVLDDHDSPNDHGQRPPTILTAGIPVLQ